MLTTFKFSLHEHSCTSLYITEEKRNIRYMYNYYGYVCISVQIIYTYVYTYNFNVQWIYLIFNEVWTKIHNHTKKVQ